MIHREASLLLGGLDGLEHAKARLLNIGDGGVLLLLEGRIPGLELLDLGLEGGLGILKRLLALGDLGVKSGGVHGHSGLNFSLLGSVTEVEVVRSTAWSKVLLQGLRAEGEHMDMTSVAP